MKKIKYDEIKCLKILELKIIGYQLNAYFISGFLKNLKIRILQFLLKMSGARNIMSYTLNMIYPSPV